MKENAKTFSACDVVRFYAGASELQKAECTILEQMREGLAGARMLDIGVGGGRTTPHFAPAVREYVGVDYAPEMIDACRKRFADDPWRFDVADVRALKAFTDREFDFVLFSFNGIDYIDHDDRLRALDEVRRVLRPGAPFVFSSHNMGTLGRLFAFEPCGVLAAVEGALKWARLRLNNPKLDELKARPWAIVNDGSYRFRGRTYYVRPDEQVRQLEAAGFVDIELYTLEAGLRADESACAASADSWLYYTCRRR